MQGATCSNLSGTTCNEAMSSLAAQSAAETHSKPSTNAYYSQQQQTPQPRSNVVVVSQQPTVVTRPVYSSDNPDVGSGPMIFAISVTVFAVCCCWWALFCSIPAIIFASNASSAGDSESARSNKNISLGLSAATIVTGIIGLGIVFGLVFGYYLPLAQSTVRSTNTRITFG